MCLGWNKSLAWIIANWWWWWLVFYGHFCAYRYLRVINSVFVKFSSWWQMVAIWTENTRSVFLCIDQYVLRDNLFILLVFMEPILESGWIDFQFYCLVNSMMFGLKSVVKFLFSHSFQLGLSWKSVWQKKILLFYLC